MNENEKTDPDIDYTGHLICLGLGSNINPTENIIKVVAELKKRLKVVAVSSAWESPAAGDVAPDFINAAMLVETPLDLDQLKSTIIRPIEADLGRVRTSDKNSPRTIDIDILIVDGRELDPQLWELAFLAVPVAQLIPSLTNEATGESIAQAAQRLSCDVCIQPRQDIYLDRL